MAIWLSEGSKRFLLGALKTAIGFLLLGIGSGALVSLARPVFEAIRKLGSSAEIIPLDPYFSLSQSQEFLAHISQNIKSGIDYSSLFTFTLLIAFIVNIIFVATKDEQIPMHYNDYWTHYASTISCSYFSFLCFTI